MVKTLIKQVGRVNSRWADGYDDVLLLRCKLENEIGVADESKYFTAPLYNTELLRMC